jgi:hypothetical protein
MEKAQRTTRNLIGKARQRRNNASLLVSLLIVACYLFSAACKSNDNNVKPEPRAAATPAPSARQEAPIAANTSVATQEPTPAEALELPPPKPEEVRAVVARVYKDAVTIDTNRQPFYIVGDFNGDDSEDIAVVVKPARGKLEEINSEVANWILEDPQQVRLPDQSKAVQSQPQAPEPVKAQPDEALLTIIHGYKAEGWRNPAAQQAYLLSNAVGNTMSTEPLRDMQSATINKSILSKNAAVIRATLAGAQGFLYWTGAKYAWHKKQ